MSQYRIVAPRSSGPSLTQLDFLVTAQRDTLVSIPFDVDTAFLEVETWTVLAPAEATVTIEITGKWSHGLLPPEDRKEANIYLVFSKPDLPVSIEELPTSYVPQPVNCLIVLTRETSLNALYVVHFRGMVGRGEAALYIGQGIIIGVDAELNRFSGHYHPESEVLRLAATLTATGPSGLVTGDLLKRGDSVSIRGVLPRDFEEGTFYEIRVAGKQVHIVLEKIGDIPGLPQ